MIRKIIKIGNSDGVTIPSAAMKAYGLKVGDRVEVFVARPGVLAERLKLLDMADEVAVNQALVPRHQHYEAIPRSHRARAWSGIAIKRSRKFRE